MDNTELTCISLCTGYGGIERGLELATGRHCRVLAYSEIEAYCIELLLARMEEGYLPAAPIWPDLRTFPSEEFIGEVDIITGGFPCQPWSQSGQRKGDEDKRHLFPHIMRIVETVKPRYLLFENVEGIISATLKGTEWADPAGTPVLLHVCRELERHGYEASWGIFSASEVGAPHQRKRVFIFGRRGVVQDDADCTLGQRRPI